MSIKLVSQEGQQFVVDKSIACKSALIKSMLEFDDDEDDSIPIPGVKSNELEKVLAFCSNYKESDPPQIEKPLKSNQIEDVVPAFDAKLVDLELDEVFELLLAANYLDIKSLLDLCSAKVTLLIKGTFYIGITF